MSGGRGVIEEVRGREWLRCGGAEGGAEAQVGGKRAGREGGGLLGSGGGEVEHGVMVYTAY